MAKKIDLSKDIKQITKAILSQSKAINENTKSMRANGQAVMSMSTNIQALATSQKQMAKNLERLTKAQEKNNKSTSLGRKGGLLQLKNNRLLSYSFATLRSQLLLVAFAATMWKKSLGGLLKQHSDFQGSIGRITTGLASTGRESRIVTQELLRMTEAMQESTGVAQTDINEITALGLTFANVGTHDMKRFNQAVLDMTIGLNAGEYSFEKAKSNAILLGKALNDPVQGLSALRRVGVTMSDDMQRQIETLARFGDTAAAQTKIFELMNEQFKDKSTVEGYEKTMRSLDSAIADLKRAFGEEFADNIVFIAEKMTEFIKELETDDVYEFGYNIAWTATQLVALRLALTGGIKLMGMKVGVVATLTGGLAGLRTAFTTMTAGITGSSIAMRTMNILVKLLSGKWRLGALILSLTGLSYWWDRNTEDAKKFNTELANANDLAGGLDVPEYTGATPTQAGSVVVSGPTLAESNQEAIDSLKALIETKREDIITTKESMSGYKDWGEEYKSELKSVEKELSLLATVFMLIEAARDESFDTLESGKTANNLSTSIFNTSEEVKALNLRFIQLARDNDLDKLSDQLEELWNKPYGKGGISELIDDMGDDFGKDLHDALTRFGQILAKFETDRSVGISPAMWKSRGGEELQEQIDIIEKNLSTLKKYGLDDPGGLVKLLEVGLKAFTGVNVQAMSALTDTTGQLVTGFDEGDRGMKRWKAGLEALTVLADAMEKKMSDNKDISSKEYKELEEELTSLRAQIRGYNDEIEQLTTEKKKVVEVTKDEVDAVGKLSKAHAGVMWSYKQMADKDIAKYIEKLRVSNTMHGVVGDTLANNLLPQLMKLQMHIDKQSGKPILNEKGFYDAQKILNQFKEYATIDNEDIQKIYDFAKLWNLVPTEVEKLVRAGEQVVIVATSLSKAATTEDIELWAETYNMSVDQVKKNLEGLAEGEYLTGTPGDVLEVTFVKQYEQLLKMFEAFDKLKPRSHFDLIAKSLGTSTPILKEWTDLVFEAANALTHWFGKMQDIEKQRINNIHAERMETVSHIRNESVKELYQKKADAARDKRMKELFEKHKTNQIAMAWISGAQGSMNVLMEPAPPGMTFPVANLLRTIQIGTILATTIANVKQIKSQKSFALGGYVSGERHSRGGVNANLEGGEYIMSRRAVNEFGVEALDQLNKGKAGGGSQVVVNVTFTGNVNSSDFVEDEVIPTIKDAIKRGVDIGVS